MYVAPTYRRVFADYTKGSISSAVNKLRSGLNNSRSDERYRYTCYVHQDTDV